MSQIESTTQRLVELVVDFSIGQRLDDHRKSIDELSQKLSRAELVDAILQRQTRLEGQRMELERLQAELVTVHRLKETALTVECHTLQSTVDSINLALAELGTQLFDDPISISLQLFKTLKTRDRVKPTVNVAITYRCGEYDNVGQLSGGEADRVSLALTLALARQNSCPLLLLDECISSLDGQHKEQSLRTIRKTMGKTKTIIIVGHDAVEGYYDSVIELV